MTTGDSFNRRRFNAALGAAGLASALSPFRIVRAQSQKLKVGVILPRSGFMGLIGQSCQKGAELAPGVLKELLGVDVEIMSGDTESSVDTARTRAERLIQEGAHVLVGAFDSGSTMAIAQVAEQRGVPLVVNIAASPVTDQGYKYVFRNFYEAPVMLRNGLSMIGELFQATNVAPRTAVYMHVNDTFGEAMTKGINAFMPKLTHLSFKIVGDVGYDAATRDLSAEVSKAKATKADFILLVCRLNDSILLRREMIKQRWNPMGIISPGSPGMYEEQYFKTLGKFSDHSISIVPWYNPNAPLTKMVEKAFLRQNPKDKLVYHGVNVGFTFEAIYIAADAFKRAGSTDPKALREAIAQTHITNKMTVGGPIKFNAKGQVEAVESACVQNRDGIPHVVLPASAATAKPVFPAPYYKA